MKIEIIDMNKNWLMDVVTTDETYEFWIYKKNIGIKTFMFGLPKKQQSYAKALEIAKANYPDYKDDYFTYYFE